MIANNLDKTFIDMRNRYK